MRSPSAACLVVMLLIRLSGMRVPKSTVYNLGACALSPSEGGFCANRTVAETISGIRREGTDIRVGLLQTILDEPLTAKVARLLRHHRQPDTFRAHHPIKPDADGRVATGGIREAKVDLIEAGKARSYPDVEYRARNQPCAVELHPELTAPPDGGG